MPKLFKKRFQFAADPQEIQAEVDPDSVFDPEPPAAANYRPADVDGVSCASCVKFDAIGLSDDNVPVGVCKLWEAEVRGDFVSDGFAEDTPALDENGDNVDMWDFSDTSFKKVHMSETSQEEKEGFIIKNILRTGEWGTTPTNNGFVDKKLTIIRDGKSDPSKHIISLQELVDNFNLSVIPNVQIPLSDEDKDHKNTTRVNTGFVREVWIEDGEDGISRLMAKMEFTEPDVKEKILRGTYKDVSCGIPVAIKKGGNYYNAILEHVCITNRPFIDQLEPFSIAASDQHDIDVEYLVLSEQKEEESDSTEEEHEEKVVLSESELIQACQELLINDFALSESYKVEKAIGDKIEVINTVSETKWLVPVSLTTSTTNPVQLSQIEDWQMVNSNTPFSEHSGGETPAEDTPQPSDDINPLKEARKLRELRFSRNNINQEKEKNMPELGIPALDTLELSDEARAALQSVLEENASLKARSREAEANSRIDELKEIGLSERPGALKFYRQVYLSDDGGPAVILLSDDGEEKQRLTALEVLDGFIEGLVGSNSKITLSDQALVSGNDVPPPANADNEVEKPVEERFAEAKEAIYGKK